MRITEKKLRKLIRESLEGIPGRPVWHSYSRNEDRHKRYKAQMRGYNEGTESTHPMSNAVVLAGRFVAALQHDRAAVEMLGQSPHHAWVIFYDESGEVETWFTGKTEGAKIETGFSSGEEGDSLPGGRRTASRALLGRWKTEALKKACQNPSKANAQATEWGALEGFERESFDDPMSATVRWLVKPAGVSSEEVKRLVRSAFESYKGTNPYDFLPASGGLTRSTGGHCTRNSNSFAHSLIRHAGVKNPVQELIPLPGTKTYDPDMFPGEQLQIDNVTKKV